jgi:hypothetical protein
MKAFQRNNCPHPHSKQNFSDLLSGGEENPSSRQGKRRKDPPQPTIITVKFEIFIHLKPTSQRISF